MKWKIEKMAFIYLSIIHIPKHLFPQISNHKTINNVLYG